MEIVVSDGINLEKIHASGQSFRWTRVGETVFRIPHAGILVEVQQVDKNTIRLNCSDNEFRSVWKDYFDLETDYNQINGRVCVEEDSFLFKAMERQKGVRILKQDLWEMLITSIITQNRNIPAIRKSVELLSSKAGNRHKGMGGTEFWSFPSAKQIYNMPDEALDECKVGYRSRYIRYAAEAVVSGRLNLEELGKITDQECRNRLLELCGVGEKVAACVMLFGLHRLNAFPVDVWMKRILENEYPDGYPFQSYSPYNGVYQQYMFAYYREAGTEKRSR